MMHQRERHPYAMREYQGYDMPERPGFYSGNRPFRMDKIRNEPLEDDELNSYLDDYLKLVNIVKTSLICKFINNN